MRKGKPFLQMLREKVQSDQHRKALSSAPQFQRGADRLSGGRAHGSNYSAYHTQRTLKG